MKNIFLGFIATFILFLANTGFSKSSILGEIININYDMEIAFIDLNNREVKVKDIVEVKTNEDVSVYLRVRETTPVLSKLEFIDSGEYKTKKEDFRKLITGNPIVSIIPQNKGFKEEFEVQETPSAVDPKLVENLKLKNELQKLQEQFDEQTALLKEIKEENKITKKQLSEFYMQSPSSQKDSSCQEEIQKLKNAIKELKGKLKSMAELVNKELTVQSNAVIP